MSAFSRGLSGLHHQSLRLPSSIRVAVFSARPQLARARVGNSLSTSLPIRHYVKPTLALQTAGRTSVRSYMVSDPAIRTVLTTKEPVLLYKAPGRRMYMIGVYGLACGVIAAGLFTLKFRYELPEDLPFFVGPTYVVVAILLLGIGAYIFSAPVARCSSIELIPSTVGGAGVQLRIRARTVPMTRDKVIIANIGETTIGEKINPVVRELVEADRARNQDITDGLRGMFILRRGWEIAARWMDQRWTSFFLRFKFAVLRFGNVRLKVHGDSWKIDCSGYVLEDGQAIDRLIAQE